MSPLVVFSPNSCQYGSASEKKFSEVQGNFLPILLLCSGDLFVIDGDDDDDGHRELKNPAMKAQRAGGAGSISSKAFLVCRSERKSFHLEEDIRVEVRAGDFRR